MTDDRDSLHARAWRSYIEASLLLETRLDADLRGVTGLSMIDFHVLLLLAESEGRRLRMGELAARLVFSPSRLTYQVKSMERRGWVVRQPDATDRRISHAVLTAVGLDALEAARPHHQRTVHDLFAGELSDTEARVLVRVFDRLRARLGAPPAARPECAEPA